MVACDCAVRSVLLVYTERLMLTGDETLALDLTCQWKLSVLLRFRVELCSDVPPGD